MKLDNEYLTVINNIIYNRKYEYCKKSDSYNFVDVVVLLVICLCMLIGYTNNQNILLIGCFILLIVYNVLVFLIIKENKKENLILEKKHKIILKKLFKNIKKDDNTILSLKMLNKELSDLKVIKDINYLYVTKLTIKQFKNLLKNRIYKNEKKKEKFLNEI